jgi:acyl-CoA thioesterase YciA
MRVSPMPADANGNGDIFGGWIMAQVDLAGSVIPARIARGRIATVAVNQFVFKQPVSMGDLLSFYAKVTRVGRTSVTVNAEVYAERNPADLHVVKVTERRSARTIPFNEAKAELSAEMGNADKNVRIQRKFEELHKNATIVIQPEFKAASPVGDAASATPTIAACPRNVTIHIPPEKRWPVRMRT